MQQSTHNLLDSVLARVGENLTSSSDKELTGFAAAYGRKSRGGLLVIGRAVNGWTQNWRVHELRQPARRARILREIENSVSGKTSRDGCPMSWVADQWGATEDYNTARSAFWRSIRGVVSSLSVAPVDSPEWPSYLAWTNLYKVAPAEGGNPSDQLASVQHLPCRDLLFAEIEKSAAKNVLFLTGLNWAYAFLPPLHDVQFADDFNRQVALSGRLHKNNEAPMHVVVASHPQGKNETKWISEVVAAFRRIEGIEQRATADHGATSWRPDH